MARYVVSDLHGRFDLYQEIEKFRKSGDKIICLGDCGDRGPKGYETIKAVANNPDWTYMMGNHEHMSLAALEEVILDIESEDYMMGGFNVSYYNGGASTLDGLLGDHPKEWIKFFRSLPYRIEVDSELGYHIILTHAGFDPTATDLTNYDLVWDRSHIKLPWPTGPQFDNLLLIHGHTPIGTVDKTWKPKDGSLSYADGHKINIDAGSVWTGTSILLDLDTLDEHIFQVEDKNNDS